MRTRAANTDDVASWLELISEAEQLFGPMPEFESHLMRAIERGSALVVTEPNKVIGGALLSRDEAPHHIHWLYVRESRRREGAGTALLDAILQRWPFGTIEVVTFTSDTPGGRAARLLYAKVGFMCRGRADPAPDGAPRDLFMLRR